jgi:hypothetical protein
MIVSLQREVLQRELLQREVWKKLRRIIDE